VTFKYYKRLNIEFIKVLEVFIVLPYNQKKEITEWYHQYSDSIFNYILFMIHDYQQAEDLTHDTFIKAYKYYGSFGTYMEGLRCSKKTSLYSCSFHRDCEEMYCAKRFLISAIARNRRIAIKQLQLIN
jgi:hypothetical protein